AKRLLDEAGFSSISITLLVSTDRLRLSVARVVAQALADIGITAEVVALDLGTLIHRLNRGDFDLATLTLPELSEPHVFRHFLHSAFIPPAGANRGRVNDAELDRLIDEGGREPDTEKRRAIYATLAARVTDEMHVIPL